jgi:RNA polymerase sigma factor (sigma-70 family)
MTMNVSSPRLVARLTDPSLTVALSHFVRTRVPPSEVADIVQSTIADALDADASPEGDEDIARWVYGICRHKIVDWFRRMRREVPRDLEANEDAAPAESVPTSAMELMRWARKELPPGQENEQTLEWMLREGDGEKLETIAAEANVPAPRVRQRVSRLRRYYKAKWAEAIAVAALILIALAIGFALRRKQDQIAPRPEPIQPSSVPTAPPLPPTEMPALSTQPPPVPSPSSSDVAPFDGKSDDTASPKATPVPSSMPTKPMGKPPAKKGWSGTSSDSMGDGSGSLMTGSPAVPQSSAPVPPPPMQSIPDVGKTQNQKGTGAK